MVGENMRIAYITREYPPETLWGGVAITYQNTARELALRGHEVHVICQAVDHPIDTIDQSGVFIHRVGTKAKQYSGVALTDFNIHAFIKLQRVIRNHGIQIVEAPFWRAEAFLYSLLKKTPLVLTYQSNARDAIRTKTYSGTIQLLNLKMLAVLSDLAARRADTIVCEAKADCERVVEELHFLSNKVQLVYAATDTSNCRFVESKIRAELGLSDNVPLVLFVGRLEMKKGPHILSRAIPQVVRSTGAHFMFVGRDTLKSPTGESFKHFIIKQAQAEGVADKISFVDFMSPENLIRVYSACDVVVLPSLEESFGLVITEAMSCGKPVVATETGIAVELKELGLRGLRVIPIGDSESLATAIVEFCLCTFGIRSQIAFENRSIIQEKFSVSRRVDKLLQIYGKLGGSDS